MKVFLSSTAQDLDAYRKVAEETIHQLSQQIVAMEYFGALPGTPSEESERLARDSDVVVCIVAHRYGSGITRLEVEAAHKAGKDVLVWIVADDYSWSGKKETDALSDPNVFSDAAKTEDVRRAVEALSNFKAWLRKTFTASTFTTPDDLGRKIAISLTNYFKGHSAPPVPLDRISIARLPVTGAELFGREAELQTLDEAWENPNTNIVSFVAWGGVGKTALINHWLKRRMARDNYRGAERVYGWSFFSQGTTERAASADLFIDQALRWFGDSDPTSGSPWDKGERLARYIRQTRTLLILDGLEPLQYPPGPQEGRLKDAALQALLVELAAHQLGLCVISTRERIGDLVEFEAGTVIQLDLEHLSAQAGAQILRSFNVTGDDEELELVSTKLSGHAFSVTLLGSYLDEVFDGDIRHRMEIENLFEDTRFGSAAEKMLTAYEKRLGEGIELAILRLLGLFDRPADLRSIEALREPPVIIGLTESLQHFKGREWNQAVAKLRRLKLLAEASQDEPGTLDAHPLVRAHFKQQLKHTRPQGWREANYRLYEHLKNATTEFPDNVKEVSELYAAVAHACAAEKHAEAFADVYRRRIQRGTQHFNHHVLGGYGADLVSLTQFFERPWDLPVSGLAESTRGYLLNLVGSDLQSLGRLEEAVLPLTASFDIAVRREDWDNAARGAFNLGDLYVVLGYLVKAFSVAEQAIDLGDRSNVLSVRVIARALMGSVLQCQGRIDEAIKTFAEAENLDPDVNLNASWAFWSGELLLMLGEVQRLTVSAKKMLERAKKNNWLLVIALNYLLLGRALLSEPAEAGLGDVQKAGECMDQAVYWFRQAGRVDRLPLGLFGRAAWHTHNRDFVAAEHDLEAAFRIAARSRMALHLADYHLESGRLRLAQDDKRKAREHLVTAKEMIDRMGYHRRDKEVAELEAQLA